MLGERFLYINLSALRFGRSTMDYKIVDLGFQKFYMQPWTYASEFSRMNMDVVCMCVKCSYLTMDYPLPLYT